MKQLTNKQREIAELSASLEDEDIMEEEIIENMNDMAVDYISYNSPYSYNGKIVRPTYDDECNIAVVEKVKDYMVWRIYQLEFRKRGLGMPRTRTSEVAQVWFDADGNKYTLRKKFRNESYEAWWFNTKMMFKPLPLLNDGSYILEKATLRLKSCDERWFIERGEMLNQYSQVFEKMTNTYGLDNSNYEFIEKAFTGKAEWCYKCSPKLYEISYGIGDIDNVRKIDEFYDSIKVANRHHYDFMKDFSLWTDMLGFIKDCDGDLHNPQIICPTDLVKEHNKWYNRYRRNQEKIEIKKAMERAKDNDPYYQQTHGAYLAIAFGSSLSNLQFHVIQSAMEMAEEGARMHHCVGGYWQYDDSLILSCRLADGKREATIEVDTKNMCIVQIRGLKNSVPEHYDEISKAVFENMNLIREAKLASEKLKKRRGQKKALAI